MVTVGRAGSPVGLDPAIKQVSEALGVPAPTLRSWERRYGIPVTTRSAGGHRRYADGELDQIRLMRDEIGRGRRAADAALAVRLLLDQARPERRWIDRLLDAAERAAPGDVRAALDDARATMGLGPTIDGVLLPAMRQMGAWWESGRCDMPRERLMTEAGRAWLARAQLLTPLVDQGPPVVLACGPYDMHTVGLEALALLLATQRQGSRVLGARTSRLTLMSATSAEDVAAVVVVSQLRSRRRETVELVRAAEATGRPVFFAGNAFAFPGDRRAVPGTYLGDSLTIAAAAVVESIYLGSRSPRTPQQAA